MFPFSARCRNSCRGCRLVGVLVYGGRVASQIMSGTDVPSLVDKKLVARRLQVGDLEV